MARTKYRAPPAFSKDGVQNARKRVKQALVERASEVEKHCKAVVESLAVLRRLQTEVDGVDPSGVAVMIQFFFPTNFHFFPIIFTSTLFFSMKMADSGKIVLVSCIIDFDDVQV